MKDTPATSNEMVRRTTVSFDEELYKKIEALADEEQRSVPNLLVYLAAKAVKESEVAKEAESGTSE